MRLSIWFVRVLFLILSIVSMVAFMVEGEGPAGLGAYLAGAGLGVLVGGFLISIDLLFRRFHLRTFNIVALGLFFGYLMSLSLNFLVSGILKASGVAPPEAFVEWVKIVLFLFGSYLGVVITLRASDEISVSIPFVKLTPKTQQTKEALVDLSALTDPRMIDLAASGLLDKRLLLPRFLLKEIQHQEETGDEFAALKAKRALEVVKKLEILPHLDLRFQDTDFPDVKDVTHKVLRLARLLDADVLSADINRVQSAQIEGVRIINLHALSNALKPLMQRGEALKIKIQRMGKEEMQGVGYLEDGTMVVVNGAGHFIGETVKARVLSVKHTAAGRLVFCNVSEKDDEYYDEEDY